jgi:hypothetical protein
MTQKIQAGRKTTLLDTMRDNTDLASATVWNSDQPTVLEPTPASRGKDIPVLEDWVTALLIMNGVKARWVLNYWLVSNAQGAESGLSPRPSFDEVQSVLKNMAGRTAKR